MANKNEIPRFPGNQGSMFSRQRFLSGDIETYFGPGQPPLPLGEYVPPDDWPAAGMLLRVPQVVVVTANFPSMLVGVPPQDTVGGSRYGEEFVVPGNATASGDDTNAPNPYGLDYRRIKSVAEGVKATLESIRPGATFLSWTEFQDDDSDIGLSATATDVDEPGLLQFAQPPSGSQFFGTDFLHINCGFVSLAGEGEILDVWGGFFAGVEYEGPEWNPAATPPGMVSDEWYINAKARLLDAIPKFRGYRSILWPAKSDWSGVLGMLDGIAGDLVRMTISAAESMSDDLMHALADDMEEDGFSVGGFTADLTEDRLLGLIADHFGFDPSTGRDLV